MNFSAFNIQVMLSVIIFALLWGCKGSSSNSVKGASGGDSVGEVRPHLSMTSTPDISAATSLTSYRVEGNCNKTGWGIGVSVHDHALNLGTLNSDSAPVTCNETVSGRTWSAEFTVSNLDEGSLTVSAFLRDPEGNERSADYAMVKKDTRAPVIRLNAANNIFLANQASYYLSGTCSDAGLPIVIELSSDGVGAGVATLSPPSEVQCRNSSPHHTWEVTGLDVSELREGTITLRISANDSLNEGFIERVVVKTNQSTLFTVDSTPHINGDNYTSYPLSGRCAPNTADATSPALTLSVGGVSPATTPTCASGEWSATLDLTSVTDAAAVAITGAYSHDDGSASFPNATVIKDIVAPTVAIDALTTLARIHPITGTCSETEEAVSLAIALASSPNTPLARGEATCRSNSGGGLKWSGLLALTELTDGDYVISASHRDEAGNNTEATDVTVDFDSSSAVTLASNLPNIAQSNKGGYSVSGRCTDQGQEVRVNFAASSDSTFEGVTVTRNCGSDATWVVGSINLEKLFEGDTVITASHAGGTPASVTVTKDTCTESDLDETPTLGNIVSTPIIICDYTGLKKIGVESAYGLDKHYQLGASIDATSSWSNGDASCTAHSPSSENPHAKTSSSCAGMAPLGNLAGSLDGANFIIQDIYIYSAEANVGLFKQILSNGVIKNLHLGNVAIYPSSDENSKYIGGLVGLANGGTIDNVSLSGRIHHMSTSASYQKIGGLVGRTSNNTLTISNSRVYDFTLRQQSTSSSYNAAGGLLGEATTKIEIYNSSAINIDIRAGTVGGIAANLTNGTQGSRLYYLHVASGTIEGGSARYAGGIVGQVQNATSLFAVSSHATVSGARTRGSLAGHGVYLKIYNSYGVGTVVGDTGTVGGLVGGQQSSGATNSMWDTLTTTQSSSALGTPLTTAQMQRYCGASDIQNDETETVADDVDGDTHIPTITEANSVCALGDGFVFERGKYPKIKKCTANCNSADFSTHTYGTELLPGQDW